MLDDTLISFGGPVKSLGGGRIGGYLVRFSGPEDPDLTGEYFTKATDFWLEGSDPSRRIIYHHGFDPTLALRKLGSARLKLDEVGVWAEGQLDLRDAYERRIEGMVKDGKLGWSSGSSPHLVRTKRVGRAREIVTWPITEATLTPTPAEYRTRVVPLKSLKVMAEGDDARGGYGSPVAVGSHVRRRGEDGCGAVKEIFEGGEHETAAGVKCMATKDAPVAHVDMHDEGHRCTGGVKCYPVKDLEVMEDEAAKGLKAYEPDVMVPPDARVMVGLWLPTETARSLSLPGGESAESLHLTLCYIGRAIEVGTNAIERIKAACRDVAMYSPPLMGKIAGMGRFSASETSDGLDVVYASADLPNLAEFRQRLADYLQRAGVSYSKAHGFTPHITLSYVEPNADSPVKRIAPIPLAFDQLCLVVNDEKTFFPFNSGNSSYGSPMAYRSVPPGELRPEAGRHFSDHSREVVSAVGGYVGRVRDRLDARVKAGRELSAANRSEIDTVCGALESGVARLRAILDRTAPGQPDATPPGVDAKALLRLRAAGLEYDHFLTEHAR